jgi:hypothetical protein
MTRSADKEPNQNPRFFFVHLLKTGGTTLVHHICRNFPGQVYPFGQEHEGKGITLIADLLGTSLERREQLRAYVGHFPYVATQLLGQQLVVLTILRDPVERTVSYLKHARYYHPRHRSLSFEEIYEDPFYFPWLIHNHQAKMFAMTKSDPLESALDVIDVDESRLALAIENLEQVHVIGLQERYNEFIAELRDRFHWNFEAIPNQRVGIESGNVSAAFRRRIAIDNAADMEFYRYGRHLYELRKKELRRTIR